MKSIISSVVIALAVFAAACGSIGKAEETKPAANSATSNSAPATSAPSTTTASATQTGVAACDEYLALVEKAVNNPKVPQATKDMYKQSMEQNRTAWKQAASTPQGKAGLETSCKAALDAAKPALEQFAK